MGEAGAQQMSMDDSSYGIERGGRRRRGVFGRLVHAHVRRAAAVVLVGSIVLTPTLASAGSNSTTTSTAQSSVTMSGLNASFKTQQQALTQRQQLELARLADGWAKKIAERQAAATVEQAG